MNTAILIPPRESSPFTWRDVPATLPTFDDVEHLLDCGPILLAGLAAFTILLHRLRSLCRGSSVKGNAISLKGMGLPMSRHIAHLEGHRVLSADDGIFARRLEVLGLHIVAQSIADPDIVRGFVADVRDFLEGLPESE